ncbi:uncharacterized protein BXZ73DRAFT_97337 [Epithele typhae]|uniref:uncharacterized protein n=1 Tax=Epithele typhae TaxID=378194 RepID=UPI002007CC56|nr:uncharacterized protein BXZ73DRAFT_97337 [Epithele typhae]KAH9943287.1 hypothetical protein BXZ73DRAFT_97337 [Epithele typhae]
MSNDKISRRRQTAFQVLDSYKAWDLDQILACRTEDCIQQILPRSLNRPPMDNTTYRTFFGGVMPYFKNFTPEIDDIVEDERANKVVIWCHSTADTAVGPYKNEYMLTLHFNEEGDKVTKLYEFVDGANSVDFWPKFWKFLEGEKAKSAADATQ